MSKMVILAQFDRCLRCQHLTKDEPHSMSVHCHCRAQHPHVEPPADCARDEIVEWLASYYAGADLDEALAFLLGWANRRAANIIGHALEAMTTIVRMVPTDQWDDADPRNVEQIRAIHEVAQHALDFAKAPSADVVRETLASSPGEVLG